MSDFDAAIRTSLHACPRPRWAARPTIHRYLPTMVQAARLRDIKRALSQKWYRDNRDRALAATKRWQQNNRERFRLYMKAHYQRNKTKRRRYDVENRARRNEQKRERYAIDSAYRAKTIARVQEWRMSNPERYRADQAIHSQWRRLRKDRVVR